MRVRALAVITPQGRISNPVIEISDGIITAINHNDEMAADHEISGTLIPGFVDIHCHGGSGFYFTSAKDQDISAAIQLHRSNGVTSLFASLVTASLSDLSAQIERLVPFVRNGLLSGIHLEGPYLSSSRSGAHDPALLRTPKISELEGLLAVGQGYISMVTIAPELPGAADAIAYLKSNSVLVAIGHTASTFQDGEAGLLKDADLVTHFTNAMEKLRPGSFSEYLLDKSELPLELILDGVHVSEDVSKKLLYDYSNRIILVTDAMSAAGCGDGKYRIGNLEVDVRESVARLESSGALAGSTLTMKRAFLHALQQGASLESAVAMTSGNAARLLKRERIGISVGSASEILVFNESSNELSLLEVGQ